MQIKIIAVQKHKDEYIKEGILEYEKRLSQFCNLEWVFIKEELAGDDRAKIMREEGRRILESIPSGYSVIVFDVGGGSLDSFEFSALIESHRDFDGGKVAFIIGGAYGLSEEVLSIADRKISLSHLTMTHQLVRLVLMEQLYRAFSIMAGTDYHK